MINNIRGKWAARILRARYFVVLTDKESIIYLKGAKPEEFEDVVALAAQCAELEDFQDKLKDMIVRHEAQVYKLSGGYKHVKRNTAKRKKINVKKG